MDTLTQSYMLRSEHEVPIGLRWYYCAGFALALFCMGISSTQPNKLQLKPNPRNYLPNPHPQNRLLPAPQTLPSLQPSCRLRNPTLSSCRRIPQLPLPDLHRHRFGSMGISSRIMGNELSDRKLLRREDEM